MEREGLGRAPCPAASDHNSVYNSAVQEQEPKHYRTSFAVLCPVFSCGKSTTFLLPQSMAMSENFLSGGKEAAVRILTDVCKQKRAKKEREQLGG